MSESNAEAGPSRPSQPAKEHPLPSTTFYGIEFPGYVQESSVPRAIEHLGGISRISRAFSSTSKTDAFLELNWRPETPFAHPVPGSVVNASGILMKVTKRKRKKRDGQADDAPEGEFIAEAVGVLPKTVRFRGMADFQYTPEISDPISQLRLAMDRMDVNAIKDYGFPPEKEDYTIRDSEGAERSNLRLFPPPMFSRQLIPHVYNYKANPMSIVTTVVDNETGVEKKRLINKMRWKGYAPAIISFSDKTVPDKPPQVVEEARDKADKRIFDTLQQLFEKRPVWTRIALLNNFDAVDRRNIINDKFMIPLVSYTFSDGPWRDTVLKFGYDPRTDPNARFYQRVYFRNANHPIVRPSITQRRLDQRAAGPSISTPVPAQGTPGDANEEHDVPSHIFDGVHSTKETAAYQLCDIVDPMLKEMIEDESGVRDECNERDGWYTTHALEQIKTVVRYKFFSLLDGYIPTQEECEAMLDPQTARPIIKPFRPRKRNMAKGALPPEEATAARLRAALDSSQRTASGRGK